MPRSFACSAEYSRQSGFARCAPFVYPLWSCTLICFRGVIFRPTNSRRTAARICMQSVCVLLAWWPPSPCVPFVLQRQTITTTTITTAATTADAALLGTSFPLCVQLPPSPGMRRCVSKSERRIDGSALTAAFFGTRASCCYPAGITTTHACSMHTGARAHTGQYVLYVHTHTAHALASAGLRVSRRRGLLLLLHAGNARFNLRRARGRT